MRALVALVVIASACSRILGAQVVRGVVTGRVSGHPLAGVLVSLARDPDSLASGGIRHALTNARGEYAVTLGDPGAYVLSAKRIGVARHVVPRLALAAGETRRVNIVLDPFESRLPEVRVAATNLCLAKQDQLRTLVALWDEARTALLAAEVSREEQLLTGWLSQYTRSLEPRSLRILDEQRSVAEGRFDRPMRSLTGDSLAKVGYWRRLHPDTMVFYGPDAEALLSEPFQSGHCFELVQGGGAQRGMLGIAFRPRRAMPMGGIEGTIWMDGASFELRLVEFRYTNLITLPRNPHLGGQVHFLRHESGAWVVRRWYLRMPVFPSVIAAADVAARGGHVNTTPRPTVYRIIEEGAALFTPGLFTWEAMGSISGIVMDSTGRQPLRGTLVSLSGTPYSVEVDSSGSFRFDSIPPGPYTLLASQEHYAVLGQMADDEPLTLSPGQRYRTTLKAVTTSELRAILCDGTKVDPSTGTLRVLVTHADSGSAIPGLGVWLRWPDPDQKAPIDPIAPRSISTADGRDGGVKSLGAQSRTDGGGGVTFCGVPANTPLEFLMLSPDDEPEVRGGTRASRVASFIVKPGEVTGRAVQVRPPN